MSLQRRLPKSCLLARIGYWLENHMRRHLDVLTSIVSANTHLKWRIVRQVLKMRTALSHSMMDSGCSFDSPFGTSASSCEDSQIQEVIYIDTAAAVIRSDGRSMDDGLF